MPVPLRGDWHRGCVMFWNRRSTGLANLVIRRGCSPLKRHPSGPLPLLLTLGAESYRPGRGRCLAQRRGPPRR
jgi:hypothetical protein